MINSQGIGDDSLWETWETGRVKFFNPEKGIGLISPDDGGQEVMIENSPITLQNGEEVKFKANEAGMITYISSGSNSIFEVLNQYTLDLDKKYLGKEYKEIEKKYGEIIDKALKYENKNILTSARNLTQSIGDEENYEIIDFLIKFIKATLPEAFKHIIDVKDLEKEEIRKKIPDETYDNFVDSPKIQEIMNNFITVMRKKFIKTYNTYDYGKEKGELTAFAYKDIGSAIRMTINCYMNGIDPAILESTSQEIMKRDMQSIEYFEKNKKRSAIVINKPEELDKALNNIIKHEKDKGEYLNNKN